MTLKIHLGQPLSDIPLQTGSPALSTVRPDGEFFIPLHGSLFLDPEAFPYLQGHRFRYVEISGRAVGGRPVVRVVVAGSAADNLNDWDGAVDEAESLLANVRAAEPGGISLREHPDAFDTKQLARISPALVSAFDPNRTEPLHTAAEAKMLFARMHAEGDQEQREWMQPSHLTLDRLIGKQVWQVAVSKEFHYGNREQLPPPLRDTLRYEVVLSIVARDDQGSAD